MYHLLSDLHSLLSFFMAISIQDRKVSKDENSYDSSWQREILSSIAFFRRGAKPESIEENLTIKIGI